MSAEMGFDVACLGLGALMYLMGLGMALSVWVIMRREIAVFRRIVALAKRRLDRFDDDDDGARFDDPTPPPDDPGSVKRLWPDYVPPDRFGAGERWPGQR
jgi:hypothetical protein